MSQVGLNVRRIRNQLKLSSRELGAKSGIGKSALSKIENNKRSPTIRTLEKIAKSLGVQPVVLVQ
jgi:transcriptional regulator with XRE-family HTH domain